LNLTIMHGQQNIKITYSILTYVLTEVM
jgi:hypothetical protein